MKHQKLLFRKIVFSLRINFLLEFIEFHQFKLSPRKFDEIMQHHLCVLEKVFYLTRLIRFEIVFSARELIFFLQIIKASIVTMTF
jgi:hypothetical protein